MHNSKWRPRRGSTFSELIVAGSLLMAAMGLLARGTVSTGRLWQDTRQAQLALDELANQMERLTVLEPSVRQAALVDLKPSQLMRNQLAGAELTAEIVRDQDGERLVLSLQWERPAQAAPVTLVGWLPQFTAAVAEIEGGAS